MRVQTFIIVATLSLWLPRLYVLIVLLMILNPNILVLNITAVFLLVLATRSTSIAMGATVVSCATAVATTYFMHYTSIYMIGVTALHFLVLPILVDFLLSFDC